MTPTRAAETILTRLVSVASRRMTLVVLACGFSAVTGCHGILDVSDPTRVLDSDIANPAGANARRLFVAFVFGRGMSQAAADVALFTDEETIDGRGGEMDLPLNRRNGPGYEAVNTPVTGVSSQDPHLGQLDNVVTAADVALQAVRGSTPDSLKGDFLAHIFAMSGYAIVQMAEDICSGFPINHVSADNSPVFGPPFTTDSATTYGIAQLDSSLKYVHDSAQFQYFAQVVKGRALLDLGQFAPAATAVAGIPTSFVFTGDYANFAYQSPDRYDYGYDNVVTGDSEGVNGLPFVSAHDPRVPTVNVGVSYFNAADSAYVTTKYSSNYDLLPVATGTEARLIEAEAALNANDAGWLSILNALRAPVGLADLQDPGTAPARIDMLYRERAFWLYLTGRRLGDLRRLVRNYGRDPNTLFPIGPAQTGGQYGPSTAIPFVFATERTQNPYLTSGCPSQ